jgi:hypothetical protein
MRKLIKLTIASALLLSFSYDLVAQRAKPPLMRRTQTRSSSKKVKRLIGYNQSWTVSVMRGIMGAEGAYQATTGNDNFGTLQQLGEQGLVDYILAEGHRYGYLFKVRVEKGSSESPASYEAVAVPRKYGRTGLKSFYINETGVLRGADKGGAEATVNDVALDQ